MITLPKGTAAVLWGGSQWITLRWKDRELDLKLPGTLTLRARRRYVLTSPPEFGDFVKEDFGFQGLTIGISGVILTTAEVQGFRVKKTLALRDLKRLISLLKAERGTVVEVVNETLNSIGINRAVITDLDVSEEKPGRYSFSLSLVAELKDEEEVYLEEA